MKHAIHIVLGVGLMSALVLFGWLYYQQVTSPHVCTWRIEYGRMPPDDSEMARWLKSQGVTEVSIHREGKLLVITYEQRGNYTVYRALDQADALGYAERGNYSVQGMSKNFEEK